MWRYASSCRSPSVRPGKVFLVLILLAGLLVWGFGSAWSFDFSLADKDQDFSEKQDDLREVEENLSRQKAQAKKLAKEENKILAVFSRLDKTIDGQRSSLKKVRQDLKEQEEQSRRLSAKTEQLETDFATRKEVISKRLAGMYKAQRLGFGSLLWSSRSLNEFGRRYKLLKQIAKADGELFQQLKDDYQHTQQQKVALEKSRREVERQEAEQRKKLKQLEANLAEKKGLLTTVRKQKKVYLQTISELEEAAQQLKKLLEKLQKEKQELLHSRNETSPLFQLRGQLPWPAKGPVSREFGRQKHPEFGTYFDYRGIDIEAPAGETVKAVAAGEVRYADWFRGYGKIVIIDHKVGYYTLYGHLAEVMVKLEDKISAGQIIGTVGDTGSLQGPYLYFEIRQGSQQLNPRQWLSKKLVR